MIINLNQKKMVKIVYKSILLVLILLFSIFFVGAQSEIESCFDSITNGDETDVDCGGSCQKCKEAQQCNRAIDCLSDFCSPDGICTIPSCFDGWKNGNESDIDCGGICDECLQEENESINEANQFIEPERTQKRTEIEIPAEEKSNRDLIQIVIIVFLLSIAAIFTVIVLRFTFGRPKKNVENKIIASKAPKVVYTEGDIDRLKAYFDRCMKLGHTKEDIFIQLMRNDWPEDAIDKAIKKLKLEYPHWKKIH